jgi:hypothetical protein
VLNDEGSDRNILKNIRIRTMGLSMNPRYYLILIIIAGMVTGGIYLFMTELSSSLRISGTGTVNITGGSQYTLISDNGTVYSPLNPEMIHYPRGTSVYWEAVAADPANQTPGIPVRIMRIAEYVPPLHTIQINFTTNGK